MATVGELLNDASESVKLEVLEQVLCSAAGQGRYVKLYLARSHVHPDAELAAADRSSSMRRQGVGEQLRVGDTIGREVGARGQCAHQARQDRAGEGEWGDAEHRGGGCLRERQRREAALIGARVEGL